MMVASVSEHLNDALRLSSLTASQIAHHKFARLSSGRHTIIVEHLVIAADVTGQPEGEYPPFPPQRYLVSRSNDTTTRGDWLGKYGASGFVLYGQTNGSNVSKLPSWIKSITCPYCAWTFDCQGTKSKGDCACKASDRTCLEDPSDTTKRSLGAAVGSGKSISPVLFVETEVGKKYRLALYFTTPNNGTTGIPAHSESQAVRVMDATPGSGYLNPVAETFLAHDYAGGVWWVLDADRPLALRFENQYTIDSRGFSNIMSAMAFDEVTPQANIGSDASDIVV